MLFSKLRGVCDYVAGTRTLRCRNTAKAKSIVAAGKKAGPRLRTLQMLDYSDPYGQDSLPELLKKMKQELPILQLIQVESCTAEDYKAYRAGEFSRGKPRGYCYSHLAPKSTSSTPPWYYLLPIGLFLVGMLGVCCRLTAKKISAFAHRVFSSNGARARAAQGAGAGAVLWNAQNGVALPLFAPGPMLIPALAPPQPRLALAGPPQLMNIPHNRPRNVAAGQPILLPPAAFML